MDHMLSGSRSDPKCWATTSRLLPSPIAFSNQGALVLVLRRRRTLQPPTVADGIEEFSAHLLAVLSEAENHGGIIE